MSRYANAFIFYGMYFESREAGLAFLRLQGADYNSDSIDENAPDSLGFQPLEDGGYVLGFSLKPGESDAHARDLWEHRIGQSTDAESHLHAEYS